MVNLNLSKNDVQLIIDALTCLPYRDVNELIPSILTQANEQLNPPKEHGEAE